MKKLFLITLILLVAYPAFAHENSYNSGPKSKYDSQMTDGERDRWSARHEQYMRQSYPYLYQDENNYDREPYNDYNRDHDYDHDYDHENNHDDGDSRRYDRDHHDRYDDDDNDDGSDGDHHDRD
jgi:hypothetical protein